MGTKAETRSFMIKSTGRKKSFKCGKEGHPASHCPEGNNKDNKKNITEEEITISPELVDPVKQVRLTSSD